jgi:hypothetical protein
VTKTSPWVLECSEHAGAFGLEAAADHIGFDPKATPAHRSMRQYQVARRLCRRRSQTAGAEAKT